MKEMDGKRLENGKSPSRRGRRRPCSCPGTSWRKLGATAVLVQEAPSDATLRLLLSRRKMGAARYAIRDGAFLMDLGNVCNGTESSKLKHGGKKNPNIPIIIQVPTDTHRPQGRSEDTPSLQSPIDIWGTVIHFGTSGTPLVAPNNVHHCNHFSWRKTRVRKTTKGKIFLFPSPHCYSYAHK